VRLTALSIADAPDRWAALGFAVDPCVVGGIELRLGAPGRGITAWSVDGISDAAIDGLAGFVDKGSSVARPAVVHPNGAIAIDHVVVVSPDYDRTVRALAGAGIELRREREGGGFRQGFRRLGPAILELVEAKGVPGGPAAFWGLVVVVSDLDALAGRLGALLKPIRPAVQEGRRIATLSREAGLAPAVAFMDPEPSNRT
jgi:hypothetical protein